MACPLGSPPTRLPPSPLLSAAPSATPAPATFPRRRWSSPAGPVSALLALHAGKPATTIAPQHACMRCPPRSLLRRPAHCDASPASHALRLSPPPHPHTHTTPTPTPTPPTHPPTPRSRPADEYNPFLGMSGGGGGGGGEGARLRLHWRRPALGHSLRPGTTCRCTCLTLPRCLFCPPCRPVKGLPVRRRRPGVRAVPPRHLS